jgi:hypothetical protein
MRLNALDKNPLWKAQSGWLVSIDADCIFRALGTSITALASGSDSWH